MVREGGDPPIIQGVEEKEGRGKYEKEEPPDPEKDRESPPFPVSDLDAQVDAQRRPSEGPGD